MSLFYFIIIIISPFNFAFFVDYFNAQRISAYSKHKKGGGQNNRAAQQGRHHIVILLPRGNHRLASSPIPYLTMILQ